MKSRLELCFAIAALALAASRPAQAETDFYAPAQGWSRADMRSWYSLSQGSRLIPANWLQGLAASGGGDFTNSAALARYGYVADGKSGLPAGFVMDRDEKGEDWLGFNCAACHTGKLSANGHEVIVHGGQSMADFQAFTRDLTAAVRAAQSDDASFAKFTAGVPGVRDKAELRGEMGKWLAFRERIQETSAHSQWGRGRADAVGVILATTAEIAAPGSRAPLPPSNAPVSFPYVWNTNQQGRLQHNGIVDNGYDFGVTGIAKLGSLIRNWTEAMGVFAQVRLAENGETVDSSINFANLLVLEQVLARLHSPIWPEAFGKPDAAASARGEALFAANCGGCHGHLAPDDTETFLPLHEGANPPPGFVSLTPLVDVSVMSAMQEAGAPANPGLIGTDPAMACNAAMHSARTGRFEGKRNQAGISPADSDPVFGAVAISTDLLRVLMLRDMTARKTELMSIYLANQIDSVAGKLLSFVLNEDGTGYGASAYDPKSPGGVIDQFLGRCADDAVLANMRNPQISLLAYKARPLNGIWASPPYLHNGSVPTLYDLLLPQGKRPARFGFFDGAYDVKKGGLADRTGVSAATIFDVFDTAGLAILGNWNGGHEYGAALSEAERLDLLEYLKGL